MPVLKTARLRIGFGAQQKGQQVKFRRRGARSTVLHQLDFVRNDRVAPAHAFGAFGVATISRASGANLSSLKDYFSTRFSFLQNGHHKKN